MNSLGVNPREQTRSHWPLKFRNGEHGSVVIPDQLIQQHDLACVCVFVGWGTSESKKTHKERVPDPDFIVPQSN